MSLPSKKSLTLLAAGAAAAAIVLTAAADARVNTGGGRPAPHFSGGRPGGNFGRPGGGGMMMRQQAHPGGGGNMHGRPGGGGNVQFHPGGNMQGHPGGGNMQGRPGGGNMQGRPGGDRDHRNVARPGGGTGVSAGALHAGPGLHGSKPGGLSPRVVNFAHVNMHGHAFPLIRERRQFWFGGRRHLFVPLATLGVVAIAGSYWYPDAFVSIDGPACTGFTPDGCQLEWRDVDFDDGGGAPQCVQYCPQAGPPPAQIAQLPPPPPVAQGGSCALTVFAEPEFAGPSEPTSENAPVLADSGWKDAISSIQVQAGTWDFFTDENYGGETLHLPAGSYPTLTPEWNRKISSFMCVEPGAAAPKQ